MNIDFKYNKSLSNYSPIKKEVSININWKNTYLNDLNDRDIIYYLSYEIEHETIHYVLDKYIDLKSSAYFDMIAKNLSLFTHKKIETIFKKVNIKFLSQTKIKNRLKKVCLYYNIK